MGEKRETLIVSPNPGLVNQVRQALSEEQVVVATAKSAEEALVFLESRPCALVLAEVKLPGLSGFELCRLLKDAAPEPKVVLFYPADDTRATGRAREAGSDGVLARPFLSIQLIELLEGLMPSSYFDGSEDPSSLSLGEAEELDSLHIETASVSLPASGDEEIGSTNTLELPQESVEPFDEDNPVSVPVTNTATVHGLLAPRAGGSGAVSIDSVNQAIDRRLASSLEEGGALANAIEERVQKAVMNAMPEFAKAVARELKSDKEA